MVVRKKVLHSKIGSCTLTGDIGPFVDSHIIPRALAEQTWKGQPLTQEGFNGGRPVRRWTSWYDNQLVTEKGEKILSDYDDWGIKILREQRLIWSSWGSETDLVANDQITNPATGVGVRDIKCIDTDRFRLFLLSVLWRAAKSRMPEMHNIKIKHADMKKLKNMILKQRPIPYEFFPIQLVQLSTRNFPHNQAPYLHNKDLPKMDEKTGEIVHDRTVPHFRFYMDGLIVHFHLNETASYVASMKGNFVGGHENIMVLTIPAEQSRQMKHYWYKQTGRVLETDEFRKIKENLHLIK